MAKYTFATPKKAQTKATSPIPGREKEMKKNLAGGYAFKADDWQALRRWLLVGSMSGAYYQGKEQMTADNVKVLEKLIQKDPARVAQEILDASKKGISWQTPVFGLVYLSMGDKPAKDAFLDIFPEVIRNASQLYSFFEYVGNTRGFGSVIHKASKNWLGIRDASELEYQFLKYQHRAGWGARDILRKIKPVPESDLKRAVYNWASGGSSKNPLMSEFPTELARINAFEQLKKGASESDIVDAIKKYRMTWEMIPGNLEMTDKIWEALFVEMPINATLRNLANLTSKGVFDKTKNLDLLEKKFAVDNLKRAYIHPVVAASALKIYEAGGSIGRSKLTWKPINRVVDILEDVIANTFESLEPTGLHYFHAMDVSGSMSGPEVQPLWLAPYEIEGYMTLATVKAEKNYFVGGFSDNFIELPAWKKSTPFRDVADFSSGFGWGRSKARTNSLWPGNFGGTDAHSAYRYAIKNNIYTDVFVFYTDSENWGGGYGGGQPSQGLRDYRAKVNANAKAIYVTIVAYGDHVSLVDPKDPRSYDLAGFTGDTPKLIQMIARGDL